MNKRSSSLSRNIVWSIVLISLMVIIAVFAVYEKTNRKAFYDIEVEKARLIADTIAPTLALNIYLGLDDKIAQTARQLIDNPNVLGVKIVRGNETVYDVTKTGSAGTLDAFKVSKEILQPNSPRKIGLLELTYSNLHYKDLLDKYTSMSLYLTLILAALFVLYGVYIKRLLSPLREIASLVGRYTPETTIHFPSAGEDNEIGLISDALHDMQSAIAAYDRQQKEMNLLLEQKVDEKTEELRRQLYTDTLTGLANRQSLVEEIGRMEQGALLILNIDAFKEINDFFGHVAGDAILIELGERLNNLIHIDSNVTLYRLSGDEFALLIAQEMRHEELESFAKALVHNVEGMLFSYEQNDIGIRVTIGAALQVKGVLEKADIALKVARKARRPYAVYSREMKIEKLYQENMAWVSTLRYAIENDTVQPYFQPFFSADGTLAGYECLVRLIDSEGELALPGSFLEVAKQSRHAAELTRIMVRKCCAYFAQNDTLFSVNLSVQDMLDDHVVAYIKKSVLEFNVADRIVFEILESEGIENYREVGRFIAEMKVLGCRIAIDDFGSGYSNFEHLMQLDIDYIKIDGSLIRNLDVDANARVVVETVVGFAKKLKIQTVAEYIHSEAVFETAKSLGVDRFQGFYLGKPEAELLTAMQVEEEV